MFAFLAASPLAAHVRRPVVPCSCSPTHRQTVITARSTDPPEDNSTFSLDTLPSFEAFCWRTQQTLCDHTAQVDGLGTFQSPTTFPSTQTSTAHTSNRTMLGGRAFETATIDVFRNTHPRQTRTRRLLTTRGPTATTSPAERESAGVSLNLRPRDPTLSSLRANVHYFQIGGARVTWWFAGTVDLCMANATETARFIRVSERFLHPWSTLCTRSRARNQERSIHFLHNCFDGTTRLADRENSFRFVAEVVDNLLPVYLPLLKDGTSVDASPTGASDWWPFAHLSPPDAIPTSVCTEEAEHFSLSGGVACESVVTRACPLISWRFSLSPSTLTAAGKEYASLRNNTANPLKSFIYI